MAWSVPGVAVAAAAPASSHLCVPIVTNSANACKCPGTPNGNTYYVQLCVDDSNCSGTNSGFFSIRSIVKTNRTPFTAAPTTHTSPT